MQLSKLIAKTASVIYLSASLGAFFNPDLLHKMANDLFCKAGLTPGRFGDSPHWITHRELPQCVGKKLDCSGSLVSVGLLC